MSTRQLLEIVLHKLRLQPSFQLLVEKQSVGSPFVEHLKFNSFGAHGAAEASVVAVDVQLEQLVVLCKGNKGKGKKAGMQMGGSALCHDTPQSSFS